jgi:hypothetical protein
MFGMAAENPPKPEPSPKPLDSEKPQKTDPAIFTITRSVVVLTLLFGLLRMLAGISYGWLLVLVYLYFLFLAIEILVDPIFGRPWWWVRWPLFVVVLAGTIWFTVAVPYAKAPLDMGAYAMRNGDYPDGTEIGGIVWNSHYTDLRILITNASDDDYQDVDLTLLPSEMTVDAAILKDPAGGCRLTGIDTGTTKVSLNVKGGSITMTRNKNDSEVHDSAGNVYVTLFRESGYGLLCSKISQHSTIQIVSSVVGVRHLLSLIPPGSNGPVGMELQGAKSIFDLYDDKRPFPTTVTITGGYKNKTKKPFEIGHTVVVDEGN